MKLFNINLGKRKISREYEKGQDKFISRWSNPPTLNTAEWLDMFSKSPRLAVVDHIASDIANVEGHLLQINADGSETEISNHPFIDFMKHPNPLYEMTSSALWRLQEIYLLLVGEGFFLIERDNTGKPVELWNVPPHWVKMTPYIGSPQYQILAPNGLSMNVPVDDMFVMKHLNPLDPFMRGLGAAESVADEVEIDEYAAKFQKRFFYNDATPPIVFAMPDATPEQRDAFLASWNQKFRGVDNSHRAAALSGNVTIHELGNTGNKNLAFVDSRIAMRDAVLEHFGVPREIMGITENSNRATADAAQYIYAKNVLVSPLVTRSINLFWHIATTERRPFLMAFSIAGCSFCRYAKLLLEISKQLAISARDFPCIDRDCIIARLVSTSPFSIHFSNRSFLAIPIRNLFNQRGH